MVSGILYRPEESHYFHKQGNVVVRSSDTS